MRNFLSETFGNLRLVSSRVLVGILQLRGSLLGIAVALTIGVAMIFTGLSLDTETRLVEFVSVDGEINPQQRSEVLILLSSLSLSNTNISFLRSRIESVSWIARVSVERHWPNSLVVNVVPEKAIALWNDNAFINDRGEVFLSDYAHGLRLAQLYGPVGSEREVMREYQLISNALLKVGRSIEILKLNDRGAWALTNDLGIEALLGKDELMERMRRLVLVTERIELMGRLDEIQQIDTRYSNGVAVSWSPASEGMDLARTFKSQRELKL